MPRGSVSGAADFILPVGILGIGVFVLYKMGLFGGSGNSTSPLLSNSVANNTAVANTATTAQAAYAASAATVPQSLSDTELNTIVQNITSDVQQDAALGSGTQYTDDIVNQMSELNNITDLYRLMVLFGTQAANTGSWVSLCSTFGFNCSQLDLGSYLKVVLSASQLAEVNQDLSGNGINYVFT
jgi:hypothetical protein